MMTQEYLGFEKRLFQWCYEHTKESMIRPARSWNDPDPDHSSREPE